MKCPLSIALLQGIKMNTRDLKNYIILVDQIGHNIPWY